MRFYTDELADGLKNFAQVRPDELSVSNINTANNSLKPGLYGTSWSRRMHEIQTIDDEMINYHLIYCLNCIRREQNAKYNLGLIFPSQTTFSTGLLYIKKNDLRHCFVYSRGLPEPIKLHNRFLLFFGVLQTNNFVSWWIAKEANEMQFLSVIFMLLCI